MVFNSVQVNGDSSNVRPGDEEVLNHSVIKLGTHAKSLSLARQQGIVTLMEMTQMAAAAKTAAPGDIWGHNFNTAGPQQGQSYSNANQQRRGHCLQWRWSSEVPVSGCTTLWVAEQRCPHSSALSHSQLLSSLCPLKSLFQSNEETRNANIDTPIKIASPDFKKKMWRCSTRYFWLEEPPWHWQDPSSVTHEATPLFWGTYMVGCRMTALKVKIFPKALLLPKRNTHQPEHWCASAFSPRNTVKTAQCRTRTDPWKRK